MNQSFVAATIRKLTREYMREFNLRSPAEINYGFCFHFAMNVKKHIPEATVVDATLSAAHTIVRIGSLYYDSEAPSGVTSPSEIPFAQRCYAPHWVEQPDPLHPTENSWRSYFGSKGSNWDDGQESERLKVE